MAYNFPYLKDSAFLKQFDKIKLKEQFVKLTVLTFQEDPIEEIQGKVISGNFNIDGASSMRRTGSINLIADNYENNLTKIKNLLSINKKIEVLIGFTNTTNQYIEYEKIWFPLGIYVIIGANISNTVNGTNISLTLHDKMALLNGECGGTLPASIILNEIEDIDENGQTVITQPTIYQIIQQLVNHFGGEQLGKIIISDLNDKAKQIMKWSGTVPLYCWQSSSEGQISYRLSTNPTPLTGEIAFRQDPFSYGQDVGYIYTDLTYPGQLISKAGDTICSILDQIKNVLGNYEYFYDLNGNFVFQQIKNYLNKSYSNQIIRNINNTDYQVDYTSGKSVYTFEDAEIISSITNSPQFQQIKNDFIVWGKRKTLSGKQIPIRYHLAIDERPKTGNTYKVKTITDQYGDQTYIIDNIEGSSVTTSDFRTELLLRGASAQQLALDSNYYYTQLKNEWGKVYDVINGDFRDQALINPENVDFFLDFIDTQSSIGEYSIKNIGRRTVAIVDDTINCIFAPIMPDIVIIESGQSDTQSKRDQCTDQGQPYSQVDEAIYNALVPSGGMKSAYDEIKRQLYQYTTFNEQVSLTTIPIYYLQPNTRITIRDTLTGIYGDFMIKSISLPLDINSTMNISCTKALERFQEDLNYMSEYRTLGPLNVVTFNNAVRNSTLQQLNVDIDYVQNLHGYSKPWAPGQGKNLYNKENGTETFYYRAATHQFQSSPNTHTVWIPCDPNTTYTVSKTAGSRFIVCYTTETPAVGVTGYGAITSNTASSITITTGADAAYLTAYVWFKTNDSANISLTDMLATVQIEKNSTATTYEPYSNICPIVGWEQTNIYVSPTLNIQDATIYSIDFPNTTNTVYKGTLEAISGLLIVTYKQIISYNGETLSGRWISDRDEYVSGHTPTIGAQVIYELTTPEIYSLTTTEILITSNPNNIWANNGNVTVTYQALK